MQSRMVMTCQFPPAIEPCDNFTVTSVHNNHNWNNEVETGWENGFSKQITR